MIIKLPPHRDAIPAVPAARLVRLCATLVLIATLGACGASWHASRGDELTRAGRYDDAIAAYKEALRSAGGDAKATAAYTAQLDAARLGAARHHVEAGRAALADHDIGGAQIALEQAHRYAADAAEVVTLADDVVATRQQVESELQGIRTKLAGLREKGSEPESMEAWLGLYERAEDLAPWTRSWPEIEELVAEVARPAADVLVRDSERLMALEEFERALTQARRAQRIDRSSARAPELIGVIERRIAAEAKAREGGELLAAGKQMEALAAYDAALESDSQCYNARQGRNETRRQIVDVALRDAAGLRRDAKLLESWQRLAAARAIGTEEPSLAADLERAHDRAAWEVAEHFYRRGRSLERRSFAGAWLAYTMVQELAAGHRDVDRRLKALEPRMEAATTYTVALAAVQLPRPAPAGAAAQIHADLVQRVTAAALVERGVRLVELTRRGPRPDGTLELKVAALGFGRSSRPEERRKKYLDHVEFRHNPDWDAAQGRMQSLLAELNTVTQQLRPLQDDVNRLEARLAKLTGDQTKLTRRVDSENASYYKSRATPCADGTLRCPETFGAKRWARHTAYYSTQVKKKEQDLATLSPAYSELRDEVQRLQASFDQAEKAAAETPEKLRDEAWQDHTYAVTLHALSLATDATLTWRDSLSPDPAAQADHHLHENMVDFSTPPIVVKDQTIEPPRQSELPGDAEAAALLVSRLMEATTAPILAALGSHGHRFLRASERAGDDADLRLNLQLLALQAGASLEPAARDEIAKQILERTGWDPRTGSIDPSRLVLW